MIVRLLRHLLQLLVFAAVAGAVLVVVLGFVAPPTTAFILESKVAAMFEGGGERVGYEWVPYTRISPELMLAVVSSEDQRFRDHHGFDLGAIEKAAEHNRRSTSIRGASTISQQVAKNLFLWPGRTYVRKAVEAYFTVLIELFWPKLRILETYVNVVQFGKYTYGAEAAARRFFGVPAAALTPEQCALLAAVLPAPSTLHADAPSPYLRKRQHWILSQMSALGGRGYFRRIAPALAAQQAP